MILFQFKRTVLDGLKSLWLHRMRSALTMLGIVFGVCSVIAMLAIGEGASFEAQEQIRQLGSQNILVRAVKPPEQQSPQTSRRGVRPMVLDYGLTYADAETIAGALPNVQVLAPARRLRKEVRHLDHASLAMVIGTVPWFPDLLNRTVARGRFLAGMDMQGAVNVCVLEPELAKDLFPMDDPLGQTVRIGLDYFRVVGVMAPLSARRGQGEAATAAAAMGPGGGRDGDAQAARSLYVPLTTVRSRFGDVTVNLSSGSLDMEKIELHEITVRVGSLEAVPATAALIRDLLAATHKKADFEVVVPLELLRRAQAVRRTYDIVLGAIAAISLLVGGIGIMNIMLANVTERTREIGIRRAVGAKRRHILLQFLAETVLLSGTGGVLGVALGIAVPMVVEVAVDMRTIITAWSVILAFLVSVLVGVVFGLYPAWRAAHLDPIEALRHD